MHLTLLKDGAVKNYSILDSKSTSLQQIVIARLTCKSVFACLKGTAAKQKKMAYLILQVGNGGKYGQINYDKTWGENRKKNVL